MLLADKSTAKIYEQQIKESNKNCLWKKNYLICSFFLTYEIFNWMRKLNILVIAQTYFKKLTPFLKRMLNQQNIGKSKR